MAQVPYRFAHSHRQRRYGLDTLQPAVREIAVFFCRRFPRGGVPRYQGFLKGCRKKETGPPISEKARGEAGTNDTGRLGVIGKL
jgi:hypothetical protein